MGKKYFNYSTLKVIAMALMLCDHMWATIVPGNMWMTWIGRMAFPIFAYQLAEGAKKTKDHKAYGKRLFLFALISEIPFNLLYMSSPVFPFHQNVIWTLWLGYLAILSYRSMRCHHQLKSQIFGGIKILLCILAGMLLMVDYSWQGVCTVVCFYIIDDLLTGKVRAFAQLVMLILFNQVFFNGNYIPIEVLGRTFEFHTQCYAVFSLPLIWLYNGKKEITNPTFKYFGYLFYPIHMIILYFISIF